MCVSAQRRIFQLCSIVEMCGFMCKVAAIFRCSLNFYPIGCMLT